MHPSSVNVALRLLLSPPPPHATSSNAAIKVVRVTAARIPSDKGRIYGTVAYFDSRRSIVLDLAGDE